MKIQNNSLTEIVITLVFILLFSKKTQLFTKSDYTCEGVHVLSNCFVCLCSE